MMSKQRKRRATDKAAQQKGQRKPPATKAAQQAKRLRFGSVGVRSNLGHPPPSFGKRSTAAIQEGHRDREQRR